MTWLLTVLGIVALIVLHELGHFAVAKAVGMRVERFSLFFPPKIAGFKRGETEYAIGALPLGGYVKITGMSPEEVERLEPGVAARAYYRQVPWKRIAVIVAGPAVNVLIAFALFSAILLSGDLRGSETLERLDSSTQTVVVTTNVAEVQKGAPAANRLRPGDRIVAVDGRPATVTSTMQGISSHRCAGQQRQGCRAATPVKLTVRRRTAGGRGATDVALSVYPRYDRRAGRMLVGFVFAPQAKHFGAAAAAGASVSVMFNTTIGTLTGFVHALTETKARREVSSIVGISQATNRTISEGPGRGLAFLGYFSLILAVINMFPFLPLDGGHVLWSVAEKLRGKRVSLAAMYRFSSVGIVLMLFLVVSGVSNDISRLGG